MKQLREYIKKELKSLKEGKMIKMPLPNDAKLTLLGRLKLKKNHINGIQAIKSINPSYRIYLNNNQSFTISDIGNGFGFKLVTIDNKKYDILDDEHLSSALIALNDLQTKPIINPTGDETGGDMGGDTKGGAEEPTEEPAEEPAEEPET